MSQRAATGFSLLELLIVVGIILVIAAIAIPQLLRAHIAANESAAGENVRTVTTAAVAYNATFDNGFPPDLLTLGGPPGMTATCDRSNLLDPALVTPPYQKTGYQYAYNVFGPTATLGQGCTKPGYFQYVVSAAPLTYNATGTRSFCSDEPGVIHYDPTGAPPLTPAACDALPVLR